MSVPGLIFGILQYDHRERGPEIGQYTFSPCMFCFPISDQVMVPQRTVSFKCRPIHMHPCTCVCIICQKANFLENRLGNQGISVWNFWQPYFHFPQVTRCYMQEVLWTRLCSSKWCKQISCTDQQTTSEKKNIQVRVPLFQFITWAWCLLHDALHCGECY